MTVPSVCLKTSLLLMSLLHVYYHPVLSIPPQNRFLAQFPFMETYQTTKDNEQQPGQRQRFQLEPSTPYFESQQDLTQMQHQPMQLNQDIRDFLNLFGTSSLPSPQQTSLPIKRAFSADIFNKRGWNGCSQHMASCNILVG